MGLDEAVFSSALRFSFGATTDRRRGRRKFAPYPRRMQRLAATKTGLIFARDRSR